MLFPEAGTVYGGSYVKDPAVGLDPYCAVGEGDAMTLPENVLFSLEANEAGRVDFWLWIEGCDPNSSNAVKARDIALQLGFAGTEQE